MKQINWGIIGCGDVTERKSGPAFNKVEGSKLVAVMRRTASKAEDYAKRHNVPKWYTRATDLINDPDINAIYIATPPASHAQYAIQAMEAGKPVYVEKPMGMSYEDCLNMNEVSEKTGVSLFVAYYRRSLPYFNKVKELLDKNAIGKIFFINIVLFSPPRPDDLVKDKLPWRVIPEIAGGGYFYDMACHQLDIVDYLLGPISEAVGIPKNHGGLYPAEDTVSAGFVLDSGVSGTGSWCFVMEEKSSADYMEIIGSEGRITFSAFDFTPIILKTTHGVEEFLPENPENIQYYMIQAVVKELQGTGSSPSNGLSAKRTNRVMDKILGKLS
ncbi:MAG: Gfo/Idh/MocA family oxidoreductase [Bacteroidales bacterium]|nr:Gfo/Idh/MocA family oxidoreductase [Bacteroidales bacterium]